MPTAVTSAYIVVGPTKRKPSRLRRFASPTDSGDTAGTSAHDIGVGVTSGSPR